MPNPTESQRKMSVDSRKSFPLCCNEKVYKPDDDPLQLRQRCQKYFQRFERYKKATSLCIIQTVDNFKYSDSSKKISIAHNSSIPSLETVSPSPNETSTHCLPVAQGNKSDTIVADALNAERSVILEAEPRKIEKTCSFSQTDDGRFSKYFHTEEHFEQLRKLMITIMENDTELLRQLVGLSDTLRELRRAINSKTCSANGTLSNNDSISVNGGMALPPRNIQNISYKSAGSTEGQEINKNRSSQKSPVIEKVTRLYLDGDENKSKLDDCDTQIKVSYKSSQKQHYFSRKNSILRIPIPPRASNRFIGKKDQFRPSESAVLHQQQPNKPMLKEPTQMKPEPLYFEEEDLDSTIVSSEQLQEDSGHSSTDSESSSQRQHSHSPPFRVKNSPASAPFTDDNTTIISSKTQSSRHSVFSTLSSSTTTDNFFHLENPSKVS